MRLACETRGIQDTQIAGQLQNSRSRSSLAKSPDKHTVGRVTAGSVETHEVPQNLLSLMLFEVIPSFILGAFSGGLAGGRQQFQVEGGKARPAHEPPGHSACKGQRIECSPVRIAPLNRFMVVVTAALLIQLLAKRDGASENSPWLVMEVSCKAAACKHASIRV